MPDDPALSARHALAPRYWPGHLLVLAAVVTCVLLGRWQLDVWHDHRNDDASSVTHEDPVPLDEVLGPDAAFPSSGVGRPVTVAGRWDPEHTAYVADRERDGRTGVWVVTPVLTSSGSGIPVVRGWAPNAGAAGPSPRGRVELRGLLQPSEDTGAPDSNTHDDVIPEMSITDLLPRAPYDLYGGYVIAEHSTGLAPVSPGHLPGADATSGLRNLLYAFQWWVFGAFAVFMWWRWVQEEVLGRRRSPRPR